MTAQRLFGLGTDARVKQDCISKIHNGPLFLQLKNAQRSFDFILLVLAEVLKIRKNELFVVVDETKNPVILPFIYLPLTQSCIFMTD